MFISSKYLPCRWAASVYRAAFFALLCHGSRWFFIMILMLSGYFFNNVWNNGTIFESLSFCRSIQAMIVASALLGPIEKVEVIKNDTPSVNNKGNATVFAILPIFWTSWIWIKSRICDNYSVLIVFLFGNFARGKWSYYLFVKWSLISI